MMKILTHLLKSFWPNFPFIIIIIPKTCDQQGQILQLNEGKAAKNKTSLCFPGIYLIVLYCPSPLDMFISFMCSVLLLYTF